MINKFISGLSPNEKKILTVASALVLLALFDRLLVGPSLLRMHELDDKIAKEEDGIRQNMRFMGYKDRIVREASAYRDFYTLSVRSEEEITADFLKKLELLGTQSRVELSKISPAGTDVQKQYVKYLVTLDCSGKLEDITAFLYAINNSAELIKVEKMVITGNARNAEVVQASLTVAKMIVGADPAVDAKNLVRMREGESSSVEPAKTGAATEAVK